jgi:hypothetical protein
MNAAQWDEVKDAAREDIPAILDELKDKLDEASIAAMEDDGTGKVSVSLSLKIDYTKSPPHYAFDGAVSVKTKTAGPERVADDSPALPGFGKGGAA